jgi:hypothetical protein
MQRKGTIFNARKLYVTFIDGTSPRYAPGMEVHKATPGAHTIGILVEHGNICPPGQVGAVCFNKCFSAMALELEAGRRYGYDIEKTQNEVVVKVTDDTNKVVSEGTCEPCSFVCGVQQQESIMERFQRDLQERANPK